MISRQARSQMTRSLLGRGSALFLDRDGTINRERDLNLSRCAIMGDKMSDIEAGAAAGIPVRILLATQEPGSSPDFPSFERAADLREALALLRRHFAPAAPL